MNSKTIISLAALLALAISLLTSCSNDDEVANNEPAAVKFTSSVAGLMADQPVTKAAGTTWASGDAIGIYMVAAGTTTIAEGAENLKYTTAGGTNFTAATTADAIYYPVDGSTVDFIAYYPHTAGLTNFTYNVNVVAQNSLPAIDLLYSNNATGKSKTNTSVPLTFNHKLVKLILNTTADPSINTALAGMNVSIKGMNTRTTFDLKTGLLDASNSPLAITPYTTTNGAKYEAIVLPMPALVNTGDVSVEFIINAEMFVWKVPAGTSFVGGTEYTYTINITRTGISVTGSISPWTQAPSDTGTAE